MNANEFISKYIMHDSLIESINFKDDKTTIIMTIDFAFWMQQGYHEGNPETGLLEVVFHNVTEYECPDDLPFGDISILSVIEVDGRIRFAILNDMTNDYYDLFITAETIDVRAL